MSKVFLDTNILVYAGDHDSPTKKSRAIDVMREYASIAVISTQILQEYYVVATRKLGVDPLKAKAVVTSAREMEVVTVVPDLVEEAIDGSILWQLSFWDSLVIVSARSAGCETVFSEDLNSGQKYRGVEIVNPF